MSLITKLIPLVLIFTSNVSSAFDCDSECQQAKETRYSLKKGLSTIEAKISGRLGVAILDIQRGTTFSYNGDDRFPLMSTFKVLACAKMFDDINKKKISRKDSSSIKREDLITWSPVTKKLVNKKISIFDACKATMLTSDNTAANIVLEHIGGSSALTKFLRSHGDNTTRLDRIEPELNMAEVGDHRDTTTPTAMARTFDRFIYGDVLDSESKAQLRSWMEQNKVSEALLRSVLPSNWKIADRTGAGNNGSRGVIASIWKEDHPPIIVSIYLTETNLSLNERNQVIAEVGQLIFKELKVE